MNSLKSLENALKTLTQLNKKYTQKYRFKYGGVIIQPINFTQGGSNVSEGSKELIIEPAMMILPRANKKIFIPILYANSIYGAMKNRIPHFMFDHYYQKDVNILKGIYDPTTIASKWGADLDEGKKLSGKEVRAEYVAALSATLFRLKPPFLSVSYATGKLIDVLKTSVNVVWSNPIFKFWGIGIAPWAPSRSIVSSVAVPVIKELRLVRKFAHSLSERIIRALPAVKDEIEVNEVTISEVSETMEGAKPVQITQKMRFRGIREEVDTVGLYPVIKLRHEIVSDFHKLGIDFDKEKFKIPVKGKRGEEAYDLTSPTPVRLAYGAPMTLVSVFSRGTRSAVHSRLELGSLALAISDLPKIGPNDNVLRMYFYFEFEDIKTGEPLVLASATGVGEQVANQTTKELREEFVKWVDNMRYEEVITPLSIALMTIHVTQS